MRQKGWLAGFSGCAAAVLLLGTSFVAGSSNAFAGTSRFSPTSVASCLHHEKVTYGLESSRYLTRMKKYLPPGINAQLDIAGDVPGAPIPGPLIDPGYIFFFGSSALAKAGVPKLVSVWLFHRGFDLTPADQALLEALGWTQTPNSAVAATLHQTYGNVVVLWQYPRRHRANSGRVIAACLGSQ